MTATIDKPDAKDEAITKGAGDESVVDDTSTTTAANQDEGRPKKRGGKAGTKVEQQDRDAKPGKAKDEALREKEIAEAQADLEALDPSTIPVQWQIGKTPEHGGTEKQYSIYVQDKLPYMRRAQFFSLVSRTFSEAIKQAGGGGVSGNLADLFGGEDGGSLIERGRRLTQRDLTDATQFMSLAFELIGYHPDFLIDCYIILLNVPRDERGWARARFAEPWNPDDNKWGLKDDEHERIIQIFIDQNYEEIRRFFVETLPALARRVALHEKAKDRSSKKDQE